MDLSSQPFDDGGLSDAGFADEYRVVLSPTGQDMDCSFHFFGAPDEGIDAAGSGFGAQIGGVGFQRVGSGLPFLIECEFVFCAARTVGTPYPIGVGPMGDPPQNFQPGQSLLLQGE